MAIGLALVLLCGLMVTVYRRGLSNVAQPPSRLLRYSAMVFAIAGILFCLFGFFTGS